jgi:flagellar assembly factor FliW
MSESSKEQSATLVVQSSRFGEISVAADSVIEFPNGMIGFPQHKKFVMFDHKPPFAWLHSIEDPNLAFVVMDGSQFTENWEFKAPFSDPQIGLERDGEFAILIVVTVRADPKMTTANLKAPLFVNLANRKGAQVIHDDPKFPTRYHLWPSADSADTGSGQTASQEDKKSSGE